MTVYKDFNIDISLEDVVRLLNKKKVENLSPDLKEIYKTNLEIAKNLIKPLVIYESFPVKKLENKLVLPGVYLDAKLLTLFAMHAEQIIFICCTIGSGLEEKVNDLMSEGKILDAYMLDAIGAIAVDILGINVCNRLKKIAISKGQMTGAPFYPGLKEWAMEDQTNIFKLLNPERIGITLTESFTMNPVKSLTMVVGMGENVEEEDRRKRCMVCTLRDTCWLKGL